ncbi:MAG: glycosyltransferase family 1 protein [Candidatus Omnitrophota bacterium]
MPLLIGFDAQATRGKLTGLGTYTSRLLEALKQEIAAPLELCVLSQERSRVKDLNTLERLGWENWTLPLLAKKNKVDILHVPAFAPAFRKPCKLVVTVHDIAGMLFSNQIGKPSSFYWGRWLPFVIKQADRIIADSEYTKKDLIGHLKINENIIRVVYPSGHEAFSAQIPLTKVTEAKRTVGINGRYFLFVGTLEPRKNLGRILDAFRIFLNSNPEYQLILVGSKEFAHGRYSEILANKHVLGSHSIIAPGYLDPDSLNALYCGAEALVFPSLYEGFGIPILEAMASGCPVITSDSTSTPEVAGDAGMLVCPYDTAAIANAMKRVTSDPVLCRELRKKGFEQIKKFSWRKTARETIEVYKELL